MVRIVIAMINLEITTLPPIRPENISVANSMNRLSSGFWRKRRRKRAVVDTGPNGRTRTPVGNQAGHPFAEVPRLFVI